MKVYVVVEYAVVKYEEYTRVMGVFSDEDKAQAAVREYEKEAEDSFGTMSMIMKNMR